MNENYQEAIEEIQEGNDESQQRADQSPQVTHQLSQVTRELPMYQCIYYRCNGIIIKNHTTTTLTSI